MLAQAAERVTTLQNVPRKLGALRSGWKRSSCMLQGIHVRTVPLEDK
jgi:hypothetical protein